MKKEDIKKYVKQDYEPYLLDVENLTDEIDKCGNEVLYVVPVSVLQKDLKEILNKCNYEIEGLILKKFSPVLEDEE